jgi:hypothetical protein
VTGVFQDCSQGEPDIGAVVNDKYTSQLLNNLLGVCAYYEVLRPSQRQHHT